MGEYKNFGEGGRGGAQVLSLDCDVLDDSKTHCYQSPTVLMYLMVLGVGTLPVQLLGRL